MKIQPVPGGVVRGGLLEKASEEAVYLPFAPAENFKEAAYNTPVQVQPGWQKALCGHCVLHTLDKTEDLGADFIKRPGQTGQCHMV